MALASYFYLFSSSRPCVFLSFRGKDTRRTIVSYLRRELRRKELINVFKDDEELQPGDSIPGELFKAIKKSKFAVVIISKNYASSHWCLDELEMIMQCHSERTLIVIPVFYGVYPSDVRKQKRTFAKAFKKHSAQESPEKVQKWRKALRDVASLSGVVSRTRPDEVTMVSEIVEDISKRVSSMSPEDFGHVIGINSLMEKLNPLFKVVFGYEVRMIEIWGVGDIDKTALLCLICVLFFFLLLLYY